MIFDNNDGNSLLVAEAFFIAAYYHKNQKEPFTGKSYIIHIARVVALSEKFADKVQNPDDLFIVAALHDIVEDTDTTLDDLRVAFPENIVRAVDSVTRRHGETYEKFVARAKADPIGRFVKIADIQDHLNQKEPKRGFHDKYKKALAFLTDSDEERLCPAIQLWPTQFKEIYYKATTKTEHVAALRARVEHFWATGE